MTSKRNQIVDHIHGLLETITELNGRCYRSRTEAFQRAESPAIVVEPGADTAAEQRVSSCYIDWSLTVFVMVIARGSIPDEAADPIVRQVHSRVMADRTLGGLSMDCYPEAVEPTFESADRQAALTLMTFGVRYRTSIESIDN